MTEVGANDSSAGGDGPGKAETSDSTSASRGSTDGGAPTSPALPLGCQGLVIAYVRDFHESHPDMEKFGKEDHAAYGDSVDVGIVKDLLGADRKPVFNMPTLTTTTAGNFWQWYNGVEGVNLGFEYPLHFTEVEPGKWRYENSAFFPADGKGFDESSGTDDNGEPHNYHFTLELHTLFRYDEHSRQTFKFSGDDDVFTFINNRLVVDLGGVHDTEYEEVDVHTKVPGLVSGETYPLDFFFAERHVTQSNFTIETSLALERCDIIIK
jgi:fibro-slime domain-containing protein